VALAARESGSEREQTRRRGAAEWVNVLGHVMDHVTHRHLRMHMHTLYRCVYVQRLCRLWDLAEACAAQRGSCRWERWHTSPPCGTRGQRVPGASGPIRRALPSRRPLLSRRAAASQARRTLLTLSLSVGQGGDVVGARDAGHAWWLDELSSVVARGFDGCVHAGASRELSFVVVTQGAVGSLVRHTLHSSSCGRRSRATG
jgi:hypothetical protein